MPPVVLCSFPDGKDTEQKRHGIRAAGVHVAEGADLGGEADDQCREQDLAEAAFQLKEFNNDADRNGEEQQACNPVQPGH